MSGNQPPPPPNFGNQPPPPPGQVPPPAGQVPPPAGGYQTPPPGGYGTPPTPGDQPYDIGSAFSWAWNKFTQNVAQLIIAALAIFAGVVVYAIAYIVILSLSSSDVSCGYNSDYTDYSCDTSGGLPWIVEFGLIALMLGVLFLFITVIQAGMARGALGVTEGRPFKAAEVFKFQNIGQVVLLGLIYAVGYLLCFLPGVILAFLGTYALFFIIDRNMGAVDALKASANMITKDFGRAGVWALIAYVILIVGNAVCGVGVLVAAPVALLGSAYTYKKLNGQPVAA